MFSTVTGRLKGRRWSVAARRQTVSSTQSSRGLIKATNPFLYKVLQCLRVEVTRPSVRPSICSVRATQTGGCVWHHSTPRHTPTHAGEDCSRLALNNSGVKSIAEAN